MSYTYDYPMQTVTADAVIFCGDEVLLIKRNTEPFKGKWALPGGHLDETDENTSDAADRELAEETGISFADGDFNLVFRSQIGSYSQKDRDPRGRYVTVAYLYVLIKKPELNIDPREVKIAKWVNYYDLKKDDLAFDHHRIITDGHVKMTRHLLLNSTHNYFVKD